MQTTMNYFAVLFSCKTVEGSVNCFNVTPVVSFDSLSANELANQVSPVFVEVQ